MRVDSKSIVTMEGMTPPTRDKIRKEETDYGGDRD